MLRFLIATIVSCAFLLLPAQARAKETLDFLSFSLGMYNALDTPKELEARIEYRPDTYVFVKELKPWAGLDLTSELSAWAGAGLLLDLKLSDNVYLVPSFGMGLYAQGHSETDLDFPLAFRSQLELAYQFENRSRLSLAFSHLSNASLGRHNPGAESLVLYYHKPLQSVQ